MKDFLQPADQPNGLAVNGTASKLCGRGLKSPYDQIENPLRQKETCGLDCLSQTNLKRNWLLETGKNPESGVTGIRIQVKRGTRILAEE